MGLIICLFILCYHKFQEHTPSCLLLSSQFLAHSRSSNQQISQWRDEYGAFPPSPNSSLSFLCYCLFTAWDPLNSRVLQNLGPGIAPLPFPPPGLWLFLLGSWSPAHSLEMCIFSQEGCWGPQHTHWVPGSAVPGHGQSASSLEPTASCH